MRHLVVVVALSAALVVVASSLGASQPGHEQPPPSGRGQPAGPATPTTVPPRLPLRTQGTWYAGCALSHSASDDPIVAPGQPGASHLHDFLGNRKTNAQSTLQSMRGQASSCGRRTKDTAAYWVPALYQNGVKVNPHRAQARYTDAGLPPGTPVATPPADLRVVVGTARARTPADNPLLGKAIGWGCEADRFAPFGETPPASCASGVLVLVIAFPNCWNGRDLDSPDHFSHLAYALPDRAGCPSTHPVALPALRLMVRYAVGPTTGNITLASGSVASAHGDFWNTWDPATLDRLVQTCLNADRRCGGI